jgi:hypothetical protein
VPDTVIGLIPAIVRVQRYELEEQAGSGATFLEKLDVSTKFRLI